MNQEVTGCGNCPLADTEHNTCHHPAFEVGEEFDWDFYGNYEESPHWCPLKKEDLTISVKQ